MCRSRRELSNAYLLAKFGFNTAENEPSKFRRSRANFCGVSIPYVEPGEAAAALAAAGTCHGMRQTLQGSFSVVSKPHFTIKYTFESSRRDLQNALLCTALKPHVF